MCPVLRSRVPLAGETPNAAAADPQVYTWWSLFPTKLRVTTFPTSPQKKKNKKLNGAVLQPRVVIQSPPGAAHKRTERVEEPHESRRCASLPQGALTPTSRSARSLLVSAALEWECSVEAVCVRIRCTGGIQTMEWNPASSIPVGGGAASRHLYHRGCVGK